MTVTGFGRFLEGGAPPPDFPPPLQALWHEAKGDWQRAHGLAQSDESADAAWVHAYLHRVEGDLDNAAYWYRRAGRARSRATLAEEREEIAAALLAAMTSR